MGGTEWERVRVKRFDKQRIQSKEQKVRQLVKQMQWTQQDKQVHRAREGKRLEEQRSQNKQLWTELTRDTTGKGNWKDIWHACC